MFIEYIYFGKCARTPFWHSSSIYVLEIMFDRRPLQYLSSRQAELFKFRDFWWHIILNQLLIFLAQLWLQLDSMIVDTEHAKTYIGLTIFNHFRIFWNSRRPSCVRLHYNSSTNIIFPILWRIPKRTWGMKLCYSRRFF